jgi:hypothetical protein
MWKIEATTNSGTQPKLVHHPTVSDKIKTTYGFDSGVYLVILAIFSQYFT